MGRSTERILEHGSEVEAVLSTTETKTNHAKGKRKRKGLHADYITSTPWLVQHLAERFTLSLQFLWWEKNAQK